MEPISPELVLVDPALARVARATHQLPQTVPAGTPVQQRPVVVSPRRTSPWAVVRSRAAVDRLLASGALAGVFALGSFAGMNVGGTSAAASAPPEPTRSTFAKESRPHRAPSSTPAGGRLTRGEVERRVLVFIGNRERPGVPVELFDRATGLIKTNVRVSCGRERRVDRCTVHADAAGPPLLEVVHDPTTSRAMRFRLERSRNDRRTFR